MLGRPAAAFERVSNQFREAASLLSVRGYN